MRCKRCILSDKYPGVSFDAQGVCNYCNEHEDGAFENELATARATIADLVSRAKAKDGQYDAIICYSGGKDSTYVLYHAVKELKLNCLAFTLDNGFIVPDAFKNIRKITSALGVDSIIVKPSYKFMTKMYRSASLLYTLPELKRASAICSSCISLVNVTAIRLALEKGAPLVAGGFTSGQLPKNTLIYKPLTPLFNSLRAAKADKMAKVMGDEVKQYFGLQVPLSADDIHCFNPLPTLKVTEHQIIEKISTIGWSAPTDVDACSTNCAMNSYANVAHFKQFGFHPYEYELATDVRHGLLDREEALKKISLSSKEDMLRSENIAKEMQVKPE